MNFISSVGSEFADRAAIAVGRPPMDFAGLTVDSRIGCCSMTNGCEQSILITVDNPSLSELELSWRTAVFTAESGIGPLGSLHEAGDALVAVAGFEKDELTIRGSGVMVGPGLLLTATHVLDEFPRDGSGPVFFTFLPGAARAWLPRDIVTSSGRSEFDESRKVVSDLSLVSCTLNSAAHAELPLMLAPMQVALPLIGERLWAIGFRHQGIRDSAALVTPLISSGLVTSAFPIGRGERMVSPCFEVDMDTVGGMSGGAVVNSDGHLVGIVSSSWEGGPSYVTLIWEALRLRVKGSTPKLAANATVSLLGAKALGLAKLKGHAQRDPWGNVTIRLPDKESKLLFDSVPSSVGEAASKVGLNDDQLEEFIDKWGADMEALVSEAVIDSLKDLPLLKMRAFLEDSGIPAECLEVIHNFSVEDFDGIEDLWVTSTEDLGDARLSIEYYVDIPRLIWTVQVEDNLFQANKDKFLENFISVHIEGGIATMEVVQRRYFRGAMVFDQDRELFSDASITSSAMRPRSETPKRHLGEGDT